MMMNFHSWMSYDPVHPCHCSQSVTYGPSDNAEYPLKRRQLSPRELVERSAKNPERGVGEKEDPHRLAVDRGMSAFSSAKKLPTNVRFGPGWRWTGVDSGRKWNDIKPGTRLDQVSDAVLSEYIIGKKLTLRAPSYLYPESPPFDIFCIDTRCLPCGELEDTCVCKVGGSIGIVAGCVGLPGDNMSDIKHQQTIDIPLSNSSNDPNAWSMRKILLETYPVVARDLTQLPEGSAEIIERYEALPALPEKARERISKKVLSATKKAASAKKKFVAAPVKKMDSDGESEDDINSEHGDDEDYMEDSDGDVDSSDEEDETSSEEYSSDDDESSEDERARVPFRVMKRARLAVEKARNAEENVDWMREQMAEMHERLRKVEAAKRPRRKAAVNKDTPVTVSDVLSELGYTDVTSQDRQCVGSIAKSICLRLGRSVPAKVVCEKSGEKKIGWTEEYKEDVLIPAAKKYIRRNKAGGRDV